MYARIPQLPVNPPYTEEGVNHSVEFVSATGVTTNHAEVEYTGLDMIPLASLWIRQIRCLSLEMGLTNV